MQIGNLELGVSVTGVEQVEAQFNDLKQQFEGVRESAENNMEEMENLNDSMEDTDSSMENTRFGLQKLSSWLSISSISAVGLAGSFGTVSGAASSIVAGLKAAAVAVAGVVSGISALGAALLALAGGFLFAAAEISGFTDYTRLSGESIREFGRTVGKWIQNNVPQSYEAMKEKVYGIYDDVEDKIYSVMDNSVQYSIQKLNNLIQRINSVTGDIPVIGMEMDTIGEDVEQTNKNIVETNANNNGGTKKENNVEVGGITIDVSASDDFNARDLSNMQVSQLADLIEGELGDRISRQL